MTYVPERPEEFERREKQSALSSALDSPSAPRRAAEARQHLDIDEMFVTLCGEPYLLWRAVDEHGAEVDVLVHERRDDAAAMRFFRRVLRSNPVPGKTVAYQLSRYPAAKAEAKHVFIKAAGRANNRPENSHQPTRRRERQMCFRDARAWRPPSASWTRSGSDPSL